MHWYNNMMGRPRPNENGQNDDMVWTIEGLKRSSSDFPKIKCWGFRKKVTEADQL